jgi:uncharacterized membrane protein
METIFYILFFGIVIIDINNCYKKYRARKKELLFEKSLEEFNPQIEKLMQECMVRKPGIVAKQKRAQNNNGANFVAFLGLLTLIASVAILGTTDKKRVKIYKSII